MYVDETCFATLTLSSVDCINNYVERDDTSKNLEVFLLLHCEESMRRDVKDPGLLKSVLLIPERSKSDW